MLQSVNLKCGDREMDFLKTMLDLGKTKTYDKNILVEIFLIVSQVDKVTFKKNI